MVNKTTFLIFLVVATALSFHSGSCELSFFPDLNRPEYDGECVDKDPNCHKMVSENEGYCDYAGKRVKDVVCQKSCGTCGASPKPPHPEGPTEPLPTKPGDQCEDEHKRCKEVARTDSYCRLWEKVMRKMCKKTCKFCSIGPGPETKEPTESVIPRPTSPALEGDIVERCLKAHNDYRIQHGAPPLQWDPELAALAQVWADHLKATGKFYHDPENHERNIGENLYVTTPGPGTCADATKLWYDEIKDYMPYCANPPAEHPPLLPVTGHFTQLIWKKTTHVGVAIAGGVVVAKYSPPGNFAGKYGENVECGGMP